MHYVVDASFSKVIDLFLYLHFFLLFEHGSRNFSCPTHDCLKLSCVGSINCSLFFIPFFFLSYNLVYKEIYLFTIDEWFGYHIYIGEIINILRHLDALRDCHVLGRKNSSCLGHQEIIFCIILMALCMLR